MSPLLLIHCSMVPQLLLFHCSVHLVPPLLLFHCSVHEVPPLLLFHCSFFGTTIAVVSLLCTCGTTIVSCYTALSLEPPLLLIHCSLGGTTLVDISLLCTCGATIVVVTVTILWSVFYHYVCFYLFHLNYRTHELIIDLNYNA